LGAVGGLTDGQLLERFLGRRDEGAELAFAVLVERHGPMVLRVCRALLRDPHDAQDAFQATFLVLVRRAGSIRTRDSVGSWLHGVACRVAAAARSASARRLKHEHRSAGDATRPAADPDQLDLAPVLHAEIERLQAKYRVPIVLCHLEGLTHEQAAARLGWPVGTVRSRLARGRERLRLRLLRRGVAPAAAALGLALASETAVAAVPAAVVNATAQAALKLAIGWTPVSRLTTLAEGALWMFSTQYKTVAVLLVLLTFGTTQATRATRDTTDDPPSRPEPAPRVLAPAGPISIEVPARTAYDPDTLVKVRPRFNTLIKQVFVTPGQRVKKGDPLVELFSTDLAAARSDFQTKFVQWQHDKKLYDLRQKLFQAGAISRQLWDETQNNEQKSRLEHDLALDKLQVYEVPGQDIKRLITPAGDQPADEKPLGNKQGKSSFMLVAKTDGIVIERDAVPGKFYTTRSDFMVIAPLDHLWVLADIPEKYRDQLRLGQTLEIESPLLPSKIQAQVEYVADEASLDTRDIKIRTSIPNPESRLKAGMMLRMRVWLRVR
jgi:RNA polymerase sigma factor (sigma-70 family)